MNDRLAVLQREYEEALSQLEHVRLHDRSDLFVALVHLNDVAQRLESALSEGPEYVPTMRKAASG